MTLPSDAVAMAQALSVLGGRVPLAALGMVAGVASPSAALDTLLDSGLVGWTPSDPATPVHFTHPLYRSAVYGDLAPLRKRSLHAAAATVSDRHSSLAHRVAAAAGPDPRLVGDLEAEAVAAEAASQSRQAARYLEWAAELSEAEHDRETRWLRAATSLLEAGNIEAAQRLRGRVVSALPSPRRCLALGLFATHDGDEAAAAKLFEEASAADGPPDVAVHALIQLGLLSVSHSRGRAAIDATDRARALMPPGTPAAGMVAVLHAIGTSQVHGSAAGVDELDQLFPPDEPRAPSLDALVSGARGMMQFYAGRTAAAEVSLRRALDLARDGVLSEHLARLEALLSQTLLSADRWNEALVHGNAALVVASDEGQLLVLAQAHASLASVYAARGSWSEAMQHVESAEHAARQVRTPEAMAWARLARAAFGRAIDDPAAVVEALTPLEHGPDDDGAPAFATWWWPPLIAALLDLGRTDEAAAYLDRLERLASRRPMQLDMRIALFHARLDSAAGRADDATAGYEAAVAATGPDDPLLDRGALMHHMARHLLTLGRVHEAVIQLRAADELVARVGATPYQRLVQRDLESLGVGSGDSTDASASFASLSERERDVVILVASGRTNREVAKELYLSGKTVEYHLRNVFTKLGVTSRRQLRDFLPSDLGRPATPLPR
jgi:DNA-binding CsgD family transcriptional regulator